MKQARAIPVPALAPELSSLCRQCALLVVDDSCRPLSPALIAGVEAGTTPSSAAGEGCRGPRRFLCLAMKPDERAQLRWPPAPEASTLLLPRVRSLGKPAVPFVPSSLSACIQGRRLRPAHSGCTYPFDLRVSRETGNELSHWYSDDTDQIPMPPPRGQPDTPMQRRRRPDPIEGVRRPTARRHAEQQHATHAITLTTQCRPSR